jgi:magnesium-transporting ATPase (P-type)
MTAVQLRLGSDSSQALRFTGQGFSPEGEVRRGDAALHTTDRLRAMYALLPALLCNDAALSAKEDVSPAKQVPGAPPGIVAPTVVEIRDDKLAAASDKSAGAAEPTVPSSPSRTTLGHPAAASGERALASPATQSGRAALSELHQNVSLAEVARQQSERNVLAAAALAAAAATTAATAAISSTRASSSSSSSSFGSPSEAFNLTAAGVTPSGGSTSGSATADADAAAFAATVGQFSAVSYAQGAVWSVTGDPTEAALLVASMKAGWKNAVEAQQRFPRLSTVPFDSDNKFMASLHDVLIPKSLLGAAADGSAEPALSAGTSSNGSVMVKRRLLLVKGAPDRLIPRCVKAVTNGNPFDASPIVPSVWQANADSLSAEGMRVLCLAMAVVPEDKTSISAADVNGGEPSLTLTALVGIVDPPREECVAAIAECKTAGVAVKMITGDSPLTAKTIGGWLGIPNTVVLTGQQLQAMSDDELTAKVIACNIYARATPEHKLRIVQALHRHKLCAAMTGDGVNDAAALKAANVGIAMGITGTEVAKEASRMVLADDNFSTIVAAIKEGRRVYDNLKKVLLFVLPTNVAQGICILAAIVIGLPFPLNAIQILYVNMITSVTLGLVLALEEAEPGIMGRPPRRSNKGIIGKQLLWRCFFVGGLLIIAMLGNMYWELQLDGWDSSAGSDQPDENSPVLSRARAVAMTTLTSGQVSYIFNCRYLKSTSLRSDILHSNPMLLLMAALNVGLQCLLIYAPGIQTAFGLAPISGLSWLRCIAMASALFLIVEAEKAFGPRFLMPLFNPCLRPCKRVLNPRGAAGRQVESGAIALPVPAGGPSSAVSSVAVASAASPASVSLEMTSGR